MDEGIYCNNYFNYVNDIAARKAERILFEEYCNQLKESITTSIQWIDPNFPPNAHSLYIDVNNTPVGHLPNEHLRWRRVSEICPNSAYVESVSSSSYIECGGGFINSYFLNAMRLFASNISNINLLLVSSKFAINGLYTFKFYKYGKWRYIHIDDFIPCHKSGKVYSYFNSNHKQMYIMLIQKAYSKLHGSYENAMTYGMIEKFLLDIIPSCHLQCLRLDELLKSKLCDTIWDHLEFAIQDQNSLIGCGRFLPDSYIDNINQRCGILVGQLYQIVDICLAHAKPSKNYDGLTVGMICIRNYQTDIGKFTGNWSFGHSYWDMYPDIGVELQYRTQVIQHKRGLGPSPDEKHLTRKKLFTRDYRSIRKESAENLVDDNDDLSLNDIETKSAQPSAEDLHWIQIEEFVRIFNRIYVAHSFSPSDEFETERIISQWIPGDHESGACGPLIHLQDSNINLHHKDSHEYTLNSSSVINFHHEVQHLEPTPDHDNNYDMKEEYKLKYASKDKYLDAKMLSVTGLTSEDIGKHDISEILWKDSSNANSNRRIDFKSNNSTKIKYELIENSNNEFENSNNESFKSINLLFGNNPVHIYSLIARTRVIINLFQHDVRFSGIEGSSPMRSRTERLSKCCNPRYAIGFVIVKLYGHARRPFDPFPMEDIVGWSDYIEYSHVVGTCISLNPGRYGVIPFTHLPLSSIMPYILTFHFFPGKVEVENLKIYSEGKVKTVFSEDNSLEITRERDNSKSPSTYSPVLLKVEPWEYGVHLRSSNEISYGFLALANSILSISENMDTLQAEINSMRQLVKEIKQPPNIDKEALFLSNALDVQSNLSKSRDKVKNPFSSNSKLK